MSPQPTQQSIQPQAGHTSIAEARKKCASAALSLQREEAPRELARETVKVQLALLADGIRHGKVLARHLRDFAGNFGFSDSQFLLMWELFAAENEAANQNRLADKLQISPGQISGVVEKLRREKLLLAARDVADRRNQIWKLSEYGKQQVEEMLCCLEKIATGHLGESRSAAPNRSSMASPADPPSPDHAPDLTGLLAALATPPGRQTISTREEAA